MYKFYSPQARRTTGFSSDFDLRSGIKFTTRPLTDLSTTFLLLYRVPIIAVEGTKLTGVTLPLPVLLDKEEIERVV